MQGWPGRLPVARMVRAASHCFVFTLKFFFRWGVPYTTHEVSAKTGNTHAVHVNYFAMQSLCVTAVVEHVPVCKSIRIMIPVNERYPNFRITLL